MSDPNKENILIIDDQPANLRILNIMLSEYGYQPRVALNGQMALRSTLKTRPDLILLDIRMPDMDGYEVCKRLKADEQTRDIPIIFISALDEIQDKVKAFTSGGVDYITKPFQVDEVLARVKTHLALCAMQKQLREQNIQLEKINSALSREIHDREQAEKALRKLATEDPLTGCFNRRHFFTLAEQEFERATRYKHPLSAIMCDIDHFKLVNDTYGHLTGDEVLTTVAKRIHAELRKTDIFARYGGEEFVVLLPETKLMHAQQLAERLRKKVAAPIKVKGLEISLSISLGVAQINEHEYITIDTLLERADQALYAAKAAHRNRVVIWEDVNLK